MRLEYVVRPMGVRESVACCAPRHPLRGGDLSAHDPRVLADLPSPREPVLLEQLDGRAEQETILSIATSGYFGDRLDKAAAGGGDLRNRAFEPGSRDPLATVPLVDEDAGDP